MRNAIAIVVVTAITALTLPGRAGSSPADYPPPPTGQRWEHIATYDDEGLCATTGLNGVDAGDWADYDCVFNEDYGAWDLHVRLTTS